MPMKFPTHSWTAVSCEGWVGMVGDFLLDCSPGEQALVSYPVNLSTGLSLPLSFGSSQGKESRGE